MAERFSFEANVIIDGREMRIPVFAEGGAFESRSAQVQYISENFYINVSGSAQIGQETIEKAIGASRLIENLVRISFSELYGFDNALVQNPKAYYDEQAEEISEIRQITSDHFDYLSEGNINLVDYAIDTTLDEIGMAVASQSALYYLGYGAAATVGTSVSIAMAAVSISYGINYGVGRSSDILAAEMTAGAIGGLKEAHWASGGAVWAIGEMLSEISPSATTVRESLSSGIFAFDDLQVLSNLLKVAKEGYFSFQTVKPLLELALEEQVQEEAGSSWYDKILGIGEALFNVWSLQPQIAFFRTIVEEGLPQNYPKRLLDSFRDTRELIDSFDSEAAWNDYFSAVMIGIFETGSPIGSTGEAVERLRDVQELVAAARIAEAIDAVEKSVFVPDSLAAEGDFFADSSFSIYELIAQSIIPEGRVNLGADDDHPPSTNPLPDLITGNVAISSGPLESGNTIAVNYDISNIGDLASTQTLAGVYLSTNSQITASDTLLATFITPSVDADGTFEAANRAVILPSDLAPGDYWIGVIADHNNQLEESNENNNASAGTRITIEDPTPPPATDAAIRLRYFNLDQSAIEVDERVNFHFGLENIGGEASGGFSVAFYFTTSEHSFTDPIFIFDEQIESIPSGWIWDTYDGWWVSPGSADFSGTDDYFLALVVDSRNEVEHDSSTWNIHYEPLRIIGEEPNTPASISGVTAGLVVEDDTERQIASGSLTVDDPDAGENRFADISDAALAGDFGIFTFDPETGAWTYTLDNGLDAVQSLPEGVEVSDSLSVISFDGTASETITVTIRGVNDPATISGTRNATLDLGSGEWGHPAPSTEFTLLSEDRFPVSSDFNAIIQQELGPQAQLADWVDIKARYELEGGDFLREAGLVPRDEDGINGGAVTRDGARFLSGDRHYFISWGEVHSGFASHDIAWYDGDPLHLGSWYTDQRLIAFSGEQEPSDVQLPELASVSGQLSVIDPDAGEDRFRPVDPDALLGEFGTFSFNPETGAWSYVLDVAAIGADTSNLNGAVEMLTVTSLDGTASETVTVDLIAAEPNENIPASIAGDSTGLVVEDDADRAQASGVLHVTDPDAGEDRFADVYPAALAGDYGSFAFDPETGAWTYTLDNGLDAVQSLPEGAEVSDSLSVISFDGTASETITVTIRGVNDPASISGDTTGLVIEDDPEAQLVSGRLTVTDPDQGEDRFRPIGWEREQAADDLPNWQFVPMPVPHLLLSAIPQTAQVGELIDVTDLFEAHFDDFDAFRVRLSGPSYDRLVDEDGNTVGVLEGDLQIASVFSGPNALVFRDLPPEAPFWSEIPKPLEEGTLFLDVADGRADIRIEPLILNAAASEIWSPPDGVEPFIGDGTTARLEVPGSDLFDAEEPELQGDFGVFTFDAETGNWTYRLDNAAYAVQTLPEGVEVTDSLSVTSLDGTATETITVTIRGVNDPASIAGDSTRLVVEDDPDRAQVAGVLSVTDPDEGEDRFAEVDPAALAGDFGSFAFDPETGDWSYNLDNDLDAVQALPEGAEATDSLTVTSLDGTATETITVTITGTGLRGDFAPATVSGSVHDRWGNPISDAAVQFVPEAANLESSVSVGDQEGPGVRLSGEARMGLVYTGETTDQNGHFTFELDRGNSGDIDLIRGYDSDRDGGPSLRDALDVLRLSMGLSVSGRATEALDFIAADVNQDGVIDAQDSTAVLRAALGHETDHGPRWVFIDDAADLSGLDRNNSSVATGFRVDEIDSDIADLAMTGILLGTMQEVA